VSDATTFLHAEAFGSRMGMGRDRAEIPIRLLSANPFQEGLKLRRFPQRIEVMVRPRQLTVAERRVYLLVARPAQRHAIVGFAALLSG
jgi:hypothetical protein